MSNGIVAHHNDGKRHLRVLHPSMSTAGLLLACGYPWGRSVSAQPLDRVGDIFDRGGEPTVYSPPREDGLSESEEANYGSGIHEVLAARIVSPPKKINATKTAIKWGITDSAEIKAFKAHADEAVDTFIKWMTKKNPWGVNLAKHAEIRTEMSVAYNVEKHTTRLTSNPTADTHEYKGIDHAVELPGTADVVIDHIATADGDVPDLIVIDHKTGDGFNMPAENAQLKSLALANAARIGAKTVALGIFHTSTENVSTMYVDEIGREELKAFRDKLRAAWHRIGDGSLAPGAHCTMCPAISICPAHAGAIMQVETTLAMTPERVGEIAMKLAAFQEAGDRIEKEIKAWIKAYGIPSGDGARAVPMPSGKWYRTKPTKQGAWQITTKQVREVLGVEKAEELFAALRKAGFLKDREYDDWRVVNDT